MGCAVIKAKTRGVGAGMYVEGGSQRGEALVNVTNGC